VTLPEIPVNSWQFGEDDSDAPAAFFNEEEVKSGGRIADAVGEVVGEVVQQNVVEEMFDPQLSHLLPSLMFIYHL